MGFKSFSGLALAMALTGLLSVTAYAQSAPDAPPDAVTAPVKKVVKSKKVAPKADAAAATTTDAAPKATKPKPKPKGAPTVMVTVSNQRAVAALEVDAAIAGSPESKKIAGPVAAGKKTVVKVAHDKDCLFDIHASFEDGATSDATGVNLCKEKKINLVE